MKITLFIGGLSGGGAERVVSNLANHLQKNHDITILTMSNDPASYQIDKSIKRISLTGEKDSTNYVIKNFKRIIRLIKHLKRNKTDIYVVLLPITINLLLLFRSIIKVPIIVSERCDPYTRYDKSFINRWLMKTLYPKANGFVFQTEESKKYYDNILNSRGIVIPNAINHPIRSLESYSTHKKIIISAGRLTNQKNFPMLINAFSLFLKDNPEYELEIYGDGPDRESLIKLSDTLELNNKVRFPGYVNNLTKKIEESQVFVLTSNYEGMPNVLMEAMSLGKPVISTDCPIGGPRFLIDNGINGILIPRNDVKMLVNALESIANNNEYASILGRNAFKINKRLAPQKIYAQWESYIQYIYENN